MLSEPTTRKHKGYIAAWGDPPRDAPPAQPAVAHAARSSWSSTVCGDGPLVGDGPSPGAAFFSLRCQSQTENRLISNSSDAALTPCAAACSKARASSLGV